MSTQKAKFALFARLAELGFTYEESVALRRIEMTLHRWAERECGSENGQCIERDETTGKPYVTFGNPRGDRGRYGPIADLEAGALERLKAIIDARNERVAIGERASQSTLIPYHQGDCRGCMLYLVRAADIPAGKPIKSYYNRGLAVCA